MRMKIDSNGLYQIRISNSMARDLNWNRYTDLTVTCYPKKGIIVLSKEEKLCSCCVCSPGSGRDVDCIIAGKKEAKQ